MQTLPSLSQIFSPLPVVGGARTTGIGRLSVDATRELAKCANGELVSHDVVRDGIDALLQLKRASYDLGTPDSSSWENEMRNPLDLDRTCYGPRPEPGRQWMECAPKKEQGESSGDEEEESSEDEVEERRRIPIGKERQRPIITTTTFSGGHRRIAPQNRTKLPPPPKNRPPTIWHHRKSDTSPPVLPTPESPKSKISSPREQEVSDAEADEAPAGPAILHFSCLQCHRAKKRCNRTRPCSRCVSRGMDDECQYPDKHDPRSVLRACLRCWQTKKKCDRKQPSCGKCDKVGVKCIYRRENLENAEVRHPIRPNSSPYCLGFVLIVVVRSRAISDTGGDDESVPCVEGVES